MIACEDHVAGDLLSIINILFKLTTLEHSGIIIYTAHVFMMLPVWYNNAVIPLNLFALILVTVQRTEFLE